MSAWSVISRVISRVFPSFPVIFALFRVFAPRVSRAFLRFCVSFRASLGQDQLIALDVNDERLNMVLEMAIIL